MRFDILHFFLPLLQQVLVGGTRSPAGSPLDPAQLALYHPYQKQQLSLVADTKSGQVPITLDFGHKSLAPTQDDVHTAGRIFILP